MDNIWSVLYVVEKWHLIFECVRFYFLKKKQYRERILTKVPCSPLCAEAFRHLLIKKSRDWSLLVHGTVLIVVSACMRLYVLYTDFVCWLLQMCSILLVLIIISVFSSSIKLRQMEVTLALVQSTQFCLALGIVKWNVICLAYYVEANISALVAGYCKSNHRGLWGEILEQSAAVKDDIKASVSLVQFTLMLYNNEEMIVRAFAFQCLPACDGFR